MAKPKSYFTFQINSDLSVSFMDRSAGLITEWLWDFGFNRPDNTPEISTLKNPPVIVFPAVGKYRVKLKVANNDGYDVIFQDIEVSDMTPTTGFTIYDMFVQEVPRTIAIDLNQFYFLIKKWQLFLKSGFTGNSQYLFVEAYWPDLYRVLISKLILWDYITNAAAATLLSIQKSNSPQSINNPNTEAILVKDYEVEMPFDLLFDSNENYKLTINNILIDGIPNESNNESIGSLENLLDFLNGLNKGTFYLDLETNKLKSDNNKHQLTTFAYTSTNSLVNGVNTAFISLRQHFIDVNSSQTITTIPNNGPNKGPIKRMETGPSNAEWYDSSAYWANMFSGDDGSLMGTLKQAICMYASNLQLHLSICPKRKTTFAPKIYRKCP